MLVLTRKLHEQIVINGNITVTVIEIDRNKIRLGISCPKEIPIFRRELLDQEGKPLTPPKDSSDS
jgi:carbon storage regulator